MTIAISRRQVPPEAAALAAAGLSPVLARIYAARGIATAAELDHSLAALPPHDSLKGIDAAAERLVHAIAAREKIVIVADYDADGATACAIGVRGLRAMGADVDFIVPNRFEFGYGLTPKSSRWPRRCTPQSARDRRQRHRQHRRRGRGGGRGLDVLITDHHLPGATLPAPAIIVNPNQPGCAFPGKHIAGVGVMFYVLAATRARPAPPAHRRRKWPGQPCRTPRPGGARYRGRRGPAGPGQPHLRRAGTGPHPRRARACGRGRAVRGGGTRPAARHRVRPGFRGRAAPERGRPAGRHVARHPLPFVRCGGRRGTHGRRTRPPQPRPPGSRGVDAGRRTRRPRALRGRDAGRSLHPVPVPSGMASGRGGNRRVAAEGPVPPPGDRVRRAAPRANSRVRAGRSADSTCAMRSTSSPSGSRR